MRQFHVIAIPSRRTIEDVWHDICAGTLIHARENDVRWIAIEVDDDQRIVNVIYDEAAA